MESLPRRRSKRRTATGGIPSPLPSGISRATRSPFKMMGPGMPSKLTSTNASIEAGGLAEQRGENLEAESAFQAAPEHPHPLVVATPHNCLGQLAWQTGHYDASITP